MNDSVVIYATSASSQSYDVGSIEQVDTPEEFFYPLPVIPDQSWFWSEEWQAMEREAEEDFRAGRYETFESTDAFLEGLKDLMADDDTSP